MKIEAVEPTFTPVKIVIESPEELLFYIKLVGALSQYQGDQFGVNLTGLFDELRNQAIRMGVCLNDVHLGKRLQVTIVDEAHTRI